MSQDLMTASTQMPAFVQRNQMPGMVNAGAVSIEIERAVAEAKGQMQLAKMFPRDLNAAYAELMEACKQPALAQVAFYSVPQGGSKVTGPSIRLAEEIARVYGNFEFGHRELSRVEAGDGPKDFGRSEIEVYAWDKQTNNRSPRQLTVLHVLDTRDGPRKLRDQKDIDNKIANVASKQLRGRILAMMPKWMVEAAIEECKKTLAGGGGETIATRTRKMTQAFAAFGVTTEHLEAYLGHGLDTVLIDELADLTGVFNAIKEGTPASEFFTAKDDAIDQTASDLAATIKAAPEARKPRAQPKPKADPEPQQAAQAAPEQQAKPDPEPEPQAAHEVSNPVQQNSATAQEAQTAASDTPAGDDIF